MQERPFLRRTRHRLFYANAIVYLALIVLLALHPREIDWGGRTLHAYLRTGNYPPPEDVARCRQATILAKAGGDPREVERLLGQALEIDPYGRAGFLLADQLTSQGRIDEAMEHYNRYLAMNPSFIGTYQAIAALLFEQGKFDALEDLLDEGVRYFENRVEDLRPQLDSSAASAFNAKATGVHKQAADNLAILKKNRALLERIRRGTPPSTAGPRVGPRR